MNAGFRERVGQRAADAGIQLATRELEQLEQYWDLLQKWNAKINLTSLPLDGLPDETVDRLFIEPLVASSLVSSAPIRWYDLGSGGGSPAIPLKVIRPAAALTMVESRLRKTAFLREAVRTLNLAEVSVEERRFEEISSGDGHHEADLITIRAVRWDGSLAQTCSALLKASGFLLLFARPGPTPELPAFHLKRSVELTAGTAAAHLYVPRGTS
jgi:16S rRNA (guanine527-N7)-methyltransferase